MLIIETVVIREKEYTRTYSDQNRYIERDGVRYESALDPAELGREYTETDEEIVHEGEATVEDYQAALAELGVEV